MTYRFILVSDEVDDFFREIKIDSEATFLDFHKIILSAAGYPDDQMTSFFMCESNWEKCEEITLQEMRTRSDEDSWVMESTTLSEFIEDEGQRLLYVFDPLAERCFFIELKEIITGERQTKAECTRKGGKAPKQTIDFEEFAKSQNLDTDETFYGDDDFDEDELDRDGFNMGDEGGETVSLDSIDDLY